MGAGWAKKGSSALAPRQDVGVARRSCSFLMSYAMLVSLGYSLYDRPETVQRRANKLAQFPYQDELAKAITC